MLKHRNKHYKPLEWLMLDKLYNLDTPRYDIALKEATNYKFLMNIERFPQKNLLSIIYPQNYFFHPHYYMKPQDRTIPIDVIAVYHQMIKTIAMIPLTFTKVDVYLKKHRLFQTQFKSMWHNGLNNTAEYINYDRNLDFTIDREKLANENVITKHRDKSAIQDFITEKELRIRPTHCIVGSVEACIPSTLMESLIFNSFVNEYQLTYHHTGYKLLERDEGIEREDIILPQNISSYDNHYIMGYISSKTQSTLSEMGVTYIKDCCYIESGEELENGVYSSSLVSDYLESIEKHSSHIVVDLDDWKYR